MLAVAAGQALLDRVWPGIGTEDLIPGEPVDITLPPHAWSVTDDHVRLAAIGDNGSGGRQAMAVAERMARTYTQQPFGTVSLLGDISYYGDFDDRYQQVFLAPMRPLLDAGVEFQLALGNHDKGIVHDDPSLAAIAAEIELLDVPSRYYSVTRGPVELFYLDSSHPGLLGQGAAEQLSWLDDALADSTSPWKILHLHHPPYSSGTHGSTPHVQGTVVPIVRRHQVDLVLSGHDHDYERTHPIDGTTYVVSGGGCKTRHMGHSDFTAAAEATLHFLVLDIERDQLTCTAIRPDGTHADQFTLDQHR